MSRKLVLVDYENVNRIDLSVLDASFRAIVFVGAQQGPPRAARHPQTAHRFQRVDFQKVDGTGRNALDFYIAFHLGRVVETAPETECYVLSRDKGFDPLLVHVNRNGVKCRRIEALEDLLPVASRAREVSVEGTACQRCSKRSTIEHYGGLWCSNCGRFAAPPDPALLPSNQPGFREPPREGKPVTEAPRMGHHETLNPRCDWCGASVAPGDGIHDDGEWMCWACIDRHAR